MLLGEPSCKCQVNFDGGWPPATRERGKELCHEKRLSTSRYELRRLAFNEAPPSQVRPPTPVGEAETLTWEGGQAVTAGRRDSHLEVSDDLLDIDNQPLRNSF